MVHYILAAGLILSFGLHMFVVMDIIWPKLYYRVASSMHLVTSILIRFVITLALALFVFFLPDVVHCMELVGSIYFPFLGKLRISS